MPFAAVATDVCFEVESGRSDFDSSVGIADVESQTDMRPLRMISSAAVPGTRELLSQAVLLASQHVTEQIHRLMRPLPRC